MPYGFFTQLHFRTRDSILDGAMEAGQILEHGVDDDTYRTSTIEQVETEGQLPTTRLPAPASSSGENGSSPQAGSKKKSSPANSGTPRQPRRTAKTEKMFNVHTSSDS